jgi:NADP-dependent aldehyde dehydrogenase
MPILTTTDPRTGETSDSGLTPSSPAVVAEVVGRAQEAFPALRSGGRRWRAGLLEALASGLEGSAEVLITEADRETGLGAVRLKGELTRSAFQLRLFAEALREGGYLEATIDHAGQTPMGPAPDIRRMLVPLGPVAVFGASNFPFAFSVTGGDTASALAAGCPVVVKAHGSHPVTSRHSYEALADAARAYGAPEGTIGIVYGTAAGADLVADPRVRAVGFTGSLSAAKALMTIIDGRAQPIPFYGELSSVNPLVITAGAAAARGREIASGLFASFTSGAGQFCTKPGVAFVPAGEAGDALVAELRSLVLAAGAQVLLNTRIHTSYRAIRDRLLAERDVALLASGVQGDSGFSAAPDLLGIDAEDLSAETTEEAFGPLLVVARYRDRGGLARGLAAVPESLTATVHCEPSETRLAAELAALVEDRAGRIVFNGYPTGVRVGWGQHHGGPWPATNSLHTSVGVTAVRRFLRPLAWQDAPAAVLPAELREQTVDIPRRVDGRMILPAT